MASIEQKKLLKMNEPKIEDDISNSIASKSSKPTKIKLKDKSPQSKAVKGNISKSKVPFILQCRFCPETFTATVWLGQHMESKHANDNGMYTCCICNTGKEYTSRYLHKHMRRYHGMTREKIAKRLKNKTFSIHHKDDSRSDDEIPSSSKNSVNKQSKTEFMCDICKKNLSSKYNLEAHKKSHIRLSNPNNPHKCPVCSNRFLTKSGLSRHFIIHLDNNPFVCSFSGCGKKFNCEANLKEHEERHGSRTNLKCPNPNCNATYSSKRTLKSHIERCHSEKDHLTTHKSDDGSDEDFSKSNDSDSQPFKVQLEEIPAIKTENLGSTKIKYKIEGLDSFEDGSDLDPKKEQVDESEDESNEFILGF